MKRVILFIVFFCSCLSPSPAGDVVSLTNAPEAHGTLTFNNDNIHVDGNPSADFALSDVLEANFGTDPFQINYFSSASSPAQLPSDWKGLDVGHPTLAGSFSYANGTITMNGAGIDLQRGQNEDQSFVLGQSVPAGGQLTARLKEIGGDRTQAGPMIREKLDPLADYFSVGVGATGGGLFEYRNSPGGHPGWTGFASDAPPVWLRMVRSGNSLDAETSPDGDTWEIINELNMKLSSTWLGFFLNSFSEKALGKAVFDQVMLTPEAAQPETVPPGVLFRSGSFLTGSYNLYDPKGGQLTHDGKLIGLTSDQVAAVVLHPIKERQLAPVAGQTGLLMKNGDFLAADVQAINGGYFTVNSLLIGIMSYEDSVVRAAVFEPVQPKPSDYEVRLKDGSIVYTNGITLANGVFTFEEISGVTVTATTDEIAQIRAGLNQVQPMIGLPWKATSATAPVKAPPAAAGAVAAPALPAPTVAGWTGPSQEQILALPAGMSLNFPISGRFTTLALHIALAPGMPPTAQVSVSILADGNPIGNAVIFKPGGQPQLLEATLQSPKSITITATSDFAEAKTLLIDPVLIRQKGP